MTGIFPLAALITISVTFLCSSCESVADSPVEPQGTNPSVPFSRWNSTNFFKRSSSTLPLRKGVTKATYDPLNTFASYLSIDATIARPYRGGDGPYNALARCPGVRAIGKMVATSATVPKVDFSFKRQPHGTF